MKYFGFAWLLVGIFLSFASTVAAQAELAPWGNLQGIRIDGELMNFETNLTVTGPDWSNMRSTGKERQRPKFERSGNRQIVTTSIDSLYFVETVETTSDSVAVLHIAARAGAAMDERLYLGLRLPQEYSMGSLQIDGKDALPVAVGANQLNEILKIKPRSMRFRTQGRSLALQTAEPVAVTVRKEKGANVFYLLLHEGTWNAGDSITRRIEFKASGKVNRSMVKIHIDTGKTGPAFAGLGGNFRLQNPKADPQVIDYCLENLRVAYGRVEMPWRFWQKEINDNPADLAGHGSIHPAVEAAMKMAQRLALKKMPIILSAWSAPAWAVIGEPRFRPDSNGVWGNPLNEANMPAIYKSITGYVMYLKKQFGTEIDFFSFNESDLGINIRQTGEEHAKLIKGLGKSFADAGLKTKLLLGDNSDATSYEFVYPALKDPSTHPYIGAVSFHSWRGWDRETLQKWRAVAAEIKRPLLVAEGSIDAQAWGYPAIFEEESYAREEINLYIRLLNICQPSSILQWQLTSDYSPLSGGGVFGNIKEPLRPTQRFWNLKQLASTPAGIHAVAVNCDNELVTVAALGGDGRFVVHLVNNGASRKIEITGLPPGLHSFKLIVTDAKRNNEMEKAVPIVKGRAVFMLDSLVYATLMTP